MNNLKNYSPVNNKLKILYNRWLLFSFLITGIIVMSYSIPNVFALQFGQYTVRGGILEKYNSIGGPNSCLFLPLSNEWKGVYDANDNPIGHIQKFEGGDIHWNPVKGTFVAHCDS